MGVNYRRFLKNDVLEKELIGKLPEKFKSIFQKKFDNKSNTNEYWQAISEVRAVVVFCDLGIPVQEIDVKTVKDKNVDFLAVFNNERIYTEVKGFMPEDYEIARKGDSLGTDDEKINRALSRAQPKFLESTCNILVIADEDTIKPSLYNNEFVELEKRPEVHLSYDDYTKTSAIIILGSIFKDQMFEFKIFYSANPEKALPKNVMDIFDKRKYNSY